ncbi:MULTISPECIES: response regulator [Deefgea]|uniref:Response regulator n=1 Tax=Deefgea chitinilytica TaxID=570276 RepID=A0ABS2CEI2_9NEIS|nr:MULTISPECIES: response regulator [Deefgea]MBM5572552.1 response regulator [Deefgea chitinilytica]MBM9889788.1 response regulator [Deefgea sp. CFH1-16]
MNDVVKPLVLVVDDDEFMLDFICEALSETCQVITAESGRIALEILKHKAPSLILADIKMPEMDGYELCQQIKDDFSIGDTPVLFLSALDGIEDRLRGFEVGGEDFVLKPVNPKVLEVKVAHVLKLIEERAQLKSQAQYATNTAMLAMTSMSETGLMLEGIKFFNQSKTPLELANATLKALAMFDVDGVVELLLPAGQTLALNLRGPATELEVSVLQHMATMDRITQFKTRMSITYPHVRCLISNMPINDPDRCGRLRDHLAMLIEATEIRLEAINTSSQSSQRGNAIDSTIKKLTTTLANIDEMQRSGRASASIILSNVMMKVELALVGLELTERQENALMTIIQDGLEDVSSSLLAEAHFQDQLSNAIKELQNTIEPS